MAQRRRREPARPAEWHFYSFPVYFAFSAGAFLAIMLVPFLGFLPIWILSMFGTSFGLAHIVSNAVRRRTTDRAHQREEEDERERRALAARSAASAPAAKARSGAVRRRRRQRS